MWGGEIKGGLLCSTLRAWKVSAGLQEVHSSEGLQRRQSSEEDFFNFGPEVGLPAVFSLPTTCWSSSWRFCSVSFTSPLSYSALVGFTVPILMTVARSEITLFDLEVGSFFYSP